LAGIFFQEGVCHGDGGFTAVESFKVIHFCHAVDDLGHDIAIVGIDHDHYAVAICQAAIILTAKSFICPAVLKVQCIVPFVDEYTQGGGVVQIRCQPEFGGLLVEHFGRPAFIGQLGFDDVFCQVGGICPETGRGLFGIDMILAGDLFSIAIVSCGE